MISYSPHPPIINPPPPVPTPLQYCEFSIIFDGEERSRAFVSLFHSRSVYINALGHTQSFFNRFRAHHAATRKLELLNESIRVQGNTKMHSDSQVELEEGHAVYIL
jgi:hypothetical protein